MKTILFAAAALKRNLLRTALTTLSISIGIAAVMAIVALGSGTRAQVEAQIDSLGEDFIWIEPGSFNAAGVRSGFGGRRSLTADDATALQREILDVRSCSPQIEGREQIIAGNQNWNTRWRAVSPAFFQIRRWELAAGTFFSDYDVSNANRVVVLGQIVAERLFPDGENPIGQDIRMGRFPWKVIGVLQEKGASRNSVDRDDVLFVPHTTAVRNLTRKDWVDDIMCDATSPDLIDRAEFQITSLLRIRHGIDEGEDDDFSIRKPEETIALRAQATETMTTLLVAIASVSLLVGGVGIMNIMLVSVTERTREIGLRLAVGARMWDIRFQFLVEAAILGVLGGALGTAAGWLGAKGLTSLFGWPAVLSPEASALAVGVAMAAGLVFGYYPAHRASALDPIDALRTEA